MSEDIRATETVENENNQDNTVEVTEDQRPQDDAELQKWKEHARLWESRSKENQKAADELAVIKDAQKSDLEKLTERAEKAEAELAATKHSLLKNSIASEFNLTAEDADVFLTASDEDGLRMQAETLSKRIATVQQEEEPVVDTRPVIPGLATRTVSTTSDEAFIKSMFGKN